MPKNDFSCRTVFGKSEDVRVVLVYGQDSPLSHGPKQIPFLFYQGFQGSDPFQVSLADIGDHSYCRPSDLGQPSDFSGYVRSHLHNRNLVGRPKVEES